MLILSSWTLRKTIKTQEENQNSSTGWTPYEGMGVVGKTETTILRGKKMRSSGPHLWIGKEKEQNGRYQQGTNEERIQHPNPEFGQTVW